MNLAYKQWRDHRLTQLVLLVSVLLLGLIFSSRPTYAEPYLAVKNNLKCSTCHVNPNGGGMRNEFGRNYGQHVLPENVSSLNSTELARITQALTIGADARFNGNFQRNEQPENNTSKSFELSSAQLYLNMEIPETGLSLYIDQQLAPGSAINREAYVKYQFDDGDFVKAGKMYIPYGLRIEDDTAFIRQATGMNFDNSDNGVEYGFSGPRSLVSVFVANGTSQASNDDDNFLYGVRGEYLFSSFRIGGSAILNDREQQTQMYNIYGGAQWRDFTFLAEVDYLVSDLGNNVFDDSLNQLVSLVEVNYQWKKGWNFKVTAEYFDPDDDIEEDEQTRYSIVTEYTPLSNVQLRLGARFQQDIPQKLQQNNDLLFIQSHFYF